MLPGPGIADAMTGWISLTMADMAVRKCNTQRGTISDAKAVSLEINDADCFERQGAGANGSRDDIVTDGDTIGVLLEDG